MSEHPVLLEVNGLERRYPMGRSAMQSLIKETGNAEIDGYVHALSGVSFVVRAGETLALVGESGCGKSTAARCALWLEQADAGEVFFRGRDLSHVGRRILASLRRDMQMVFQDPYDALNPRLPASSIIAEPLVVHGLGGRSNRRERIAELMIAVGLDPRDQDRYAHEFSGGQRQRIAIARALALNPALIVADEPLSALDVSVQSQILNLLLQLKREHDLAYLFISHDLAVVDQIADRVAVMYLGRIVEIGPRAAVFRDARHPYTRALLLASPTLRHGKRRRRPPVIGEPANPANPPPGCPFHPRCPRAEDICRTERPGLDPVHALPDHDSAPGPDHHYAACHFRDEDPKPRKLSKRSPSAGKGKRKKPSGGAA